jgi:hypothetical protein
VRGPTVQSHESFRVVAQGRSVALSPRLPATGDIVQRPLFGRSDPVTVIRVVTGLIIVAIFVIFFVQPVRVRVLVVQVPGTL